MSINKELVADLRKAQKRIEELEATIAEQDRVIEAARAACDANKYYGDEMDALAALLEKNSLKRIEADGVGDNNGFFELEK